jgi:HSP20 family molecular chaperone IbpA
MNNVMKQETRDTTQDLPVALPAVNLYEHEHEVVIVTDLPGVSEQGVDLTVEKHVLTVSGKTEGTAPAGYELRYREFTPVEYRRTFSLTSDLDANRIQATMKHGVLTITLPKSEQAKPRKIAITGAAA